jgi:photosystem II stability/assembly factor-like uncharacterized protein
LPARISLGILLSLLSGIGSNGQQWQRLGPPGGMVISLEVGPDGVVYLGTADGHVFAKEADGRPWELRGRVGTRIDPVVSRLLTDPTEPGVVFASVWYQQPGAGGGVFRSDDAGRTWKILGLQNEAVRALESSTSQPPFLVAGARSGVFRSVDSGKTWERISPEGDPELRNVDSLAIDPRDPNVIYAGTYHLPWKTTDGGKSWKSITAGLIDDSDIMSFRVDDRNPDRIFLSACSGIYRSENQGGLWTKLQGVPYAARRTHAIVQDLQNPRTLYAGTTQGLWVTRDAGETWERATPQAGVINSVAVAPSRGESRERVLIGTESSGVLVSDDSGSTFVASNDGFSHQVVQQLVGDPRDSMHLLMLMNRDGAWLWESRDGGVSWDPLPLARQGVKKERFFVPEAIQTIYASPWGWMVRLFNGIVWILNERRAEWSEWAMKLPSTTATAPQSSKQCSPAKKPIRLESLLPIGSVMAFSSESAYVPTKEGLLRCTVTGSCVRLKAFGHVGHFRAVHVSADGARLTTVGDSKLATSVDSGQSAVWADLPVAADAVLWLDQWEQEANAELLMGTQEGLFVSGDGGASWKRPGRGLPVGQVEIVRRSHGFLAAALREAGFYVSRDEGQTWSREDHDSERSRFTGLVETAPGMLTIGSQSEGVLRWENKPKVE